MNTEMRVVTPRIAGEMLRRNPNNRKCKERHVKFLKGQMLSGAWVFDGQPLRFTESGALLDGQHRLTAIVESNTSQEFLIVSGIDSESFKVMDTGKNRSGADCFHIKGLDYSIDLAAAIKMIINIKDNTFRGGNNGVTNAQLLEWYDNNPEILDIIKKSSVLNKAFSSIMSRSWIASLMFIFSQKNLEQSEVFMHKLCYGLDLSVNSPIYVLRKKLTEDKISTAKLPAKDRIAIIIKAWNLHRKGKECKYISWDKLSKFPQAI